MSRPQLILGGDPGASAAVALLQLRGPHERPLLLDVWNVYGGTLKAWFRRQDAMLEDITSAVSSVGGDLVKAYIEDPAAQAKSKGKAHGNPWGPKARSKSKRGPDWALGLGRRQGYLLEGIRRELGVVAELLPQDKWTKELGVPTGKRLDQWGSTPQGWHRCAEADRHVEGFTVPAPTTQDDAAGEREVAKAEAVLIAACGAQRWRAQ